MAETPPDDLVRLVKGVLQFSDLSAARVAQLLKLSPTTVSRLRAGADKILRAEVIADKARELQRVGRHDAVASLGRLLLDFARWVNLRDAWTLPPDLPHVVPYGSRSRAIERYCAKDLPSDALGPEALKAGPARRALVALRKGYVRYAAELMADLLSDPRSLTDDVAADLTRHHVGVHLSRERRFREGRVVLRELSRAVGDDDGYAETRWWIRLLGLRFNPPVARDEAFAHEIQSLIGWADEAPPGGGKRMSGTHRGRLRAWCRAIAADRVVSRLSRSGAEDHSAQVQLVEIDNHLHDARGFVSTPERVYAELTVARGLDAVGRKDEAMSAVLKVCAIAADRRLDRFFVAEYGAALHLGYRIVANVRGEPDPVAQDLRTQARAVAEAIGIAAGRA